MESHTETHPQQVVRLLVTGGGTGGHTYPAAAVVQALRQRLAADGATLEVLWVGAADSLESRTAVTERIPFAPVATGKLRRHSNPLKMISFSNVRDGVRVPVGAVQAHTRLRSFHPDVVLATGGYVSIPVGLAAAVRRVPLVVHEQTVRLGLANRILARAATTVAVSADTTLGLLPRRASGVVTGNPVRAEVLAGNRDRAVASLGLSGFDLSLPTVYVTGGAQGSVQINTLVGEILPWLLNRANVIHQCGPAHVGTLADAAARLTPQHAGRYHLAGFVGAELPDVLALADVLVCRSGAGTLAEITALGKASVLIPLASSAGAEQVHNARYLADAGAAVMLEGAATPGALQAAVEGLLADPVRRAAVAERARKHGLPDAADRLADVVLAAAGR